MAGDEAVVGGGRYATDAAGYAAMLAAARHVDVLEALDEDLGAHLFRVGHRLARALRRSSLPCAGVNMFLADGEAAFQEVFHVRVAAIETFTPGMAMYKLTALPGCSRVAIESAVRPAALRNS